MRSKLGLLLLVFVVLSCQQDDKFDFACDVENPVENLEWLRNELENGGYKTATTYSDTFVYKATFNGVTVFYISICCPACGVVAPEIRTCNGETLGRLGVEIDSDDLENPTVVWKTNNGVCSR